MRGPVSGWRTECVAAAECRGVTSGRSCPLLATCGRHQLPALPHHGATACAPRPIAPRSPNARAAQGGPAFVDYLVLFFGLAIVGTGIYGAMLRDKEACRIYGGIMLMYSFIVGMMALLTALQAPVRSAHAHLASHMPHLVAAHDGAQVLDDAMEAIPEENVDCREIARLMVSNTRWLAVWFGACSVCSLGRGLPTLSHTTWQV